MLLTHAKRVTPSTATKLFAPAESWETGEAAHHRVDVGLVVVVVVVV